jgi:hypothetical protein
MVALNPVVAKRQNLKMTPAVVMLLELCHRQQVAERSLGLAPRFDELGGELRRAGRRLHRVGLLRATGLGERIDQHRAVGVQDLAGERTRAVPLEGRLPIATVNAFSR